MGDGVNGCMFLAPQLDASYFLYGCRYLNLCKFKIDSLDKNSD